MATVRRDFFLNPAERLTEQERALMTALLHNLVAEVADEIAAGLPAGLAAANDDANAGIVSELTAAGLLDIPDLIALLMRCADEERIATALRARGDARHSRFLQALVGDDDAIVSAAAMALILARGRRRDRFGQPLIEFDDIPPAAATSFVYAVAAAIRRRLPSSIAPEAADAHVAEATEALLRRHDSSRCADAMTLALVRALDDTAKLGEATLQAAADEGDIAFLAEALARRADIPSEAAWNRLLIGRDGRAMLLLRMAGVSRDFAARFLAGLGELIGIADLAEEITRFDELSDQDVATAKSWLRLDRVYRDALAALEQGNGQRSF